MLGEKQFPVPIFIGLFILAAIMAGMAIGKFFKISLDDKWTDRVSAVLPF